MTDSLSERLIEELIRSCLMDTEEEETGCLTSILTSKRYYVIIRYCHG